MTLRPRRTRDGSFSLFCEAFGEGFHSADGALAEARATFVEPAELGRFQPGQELRVVEIAVGTGTNTATLIEATRQRGLRLWWRGLELEREPLRRALADTGFRGQWSPQVVADLAAITGSGALLWGDARLRIDEVLAEAAGRCHLVLLDAFSPRRCPQLWSEEFLGRLARLLLPQGRLLTYSSAAAVRGSLQRAGLQLAALRRPAATAAGVNGGGQATAGPGDGTTSDAGAWSAGTAASPAPFPPSPLLRPLTAMEREHLASRAGIPYRDPDGRAEAAAILVSRSHEQAASGAESGSRWQRRWGLDRRHAGPRPGGLGPPGQGR